jgi:hypothetical protein
MPDSDIPSLERDVQRLLGRCILRLQQYERLAKNILANHAIVATPQALAQQRMDQAARVSKNTLGTSVKELFEFAPRGRPPVPTDVSIQGLVRRLGHLAAAVELAQVSR